MIVTMKYSDSIQNKAELWKYFSNIYKIYHRCLSVFSLYEVLECNAYAD